MARYNEKRAEELLNELCGWNDEAYDVFTEVLYRYFDLNEEEELHDEQVFEAIDDSLIYYDDQWAIYRLYNAFPGEFNWEETLSQFSSDVFDIIEKVKEGGEN